ncbi:MAG: hypothetical protein V1754_05720 [Pseudomonadota bacterium]
MSRRIGIFVIAGFFLVLASLTARMLLGARTQLMNAKLASSQGDVEAAILHLRRAMAFYLPGNPWVSTAHEHLLKIARQAEKKGQPELALNAWRQLRSAILSLRGITTPFSESLPEINGRIATLAVKESTAAKFLKEPLGEKNLFSRLAEPPDPTPGWTVLGLFGFVIWVIGSFLLLLRGLHPDAKLIHFPFWACLAMVTCGLVLFCLGMGFA